MVNSNRERRKKKKHLKDKEKAKLKPSPYLSQHQEMLDAEATNLTVNALGVGNSNLSLYYSLLRLMGKESSSSVWKANRDVFELCLFSNKPEPWNPSDLNRVCRTFDDHLDFDYSSVLRQVVSYASVTNWNDSNNPLLDRYRTLKRGETSILDYPAIMHFHASGMIEVDSPAVADCLEFISESCLDQTHQMPDNFIAMLNPKKRLPTIPQLKRLDTGLGFLRSNIEMMAHDPQFTAFIEPSLRGLFKNRFLQSDLSKLEKFPNILSFVVETSILEKKEGLRTPTLESVHLAEISSDFIEPFKRLQVSQSKTFEQHTKLLILDWRIQTIGSQNEEDFSPSCKQREKNAFLSLWSALSRGVPDSKKEFALSVKDHCVEFVMDCLSKSPRYRPDPAMVEFLAAHRPQNEILMWLQIAKAGPIKAKAIFGRLPERPKVMPFDVFYALYENYGLKSNPIFIEKYFDALPLEARREILIPWLRRATHDSQSNKQIDLLLASTFDKLLKADRFPVNELTGSAELEGDLVFWSLAFAFKSGLDLRGLSYSRLHILLMTLSRIESKILWKRLGEDLVLVLIPQMLKLENVKKGINKPLIHLLQSTHSSLILLRLKVFLEQNVTLFNFDPAWQSLIDYLDQQAQPAKKRGRLPVTKGKSKPKKVEGGYRPF